MSDFTFTDCAIPVVAGPLPGVGTGEGDGAPEKDAQNYTLSVQGARARGVGKHVRSQR
jgi:hypothetical protein